MSFQENGLEISIFPPKGEEIAPAGDGITTVIIKNQQHRKGIQIEISLDLPSELQSWCRNSNHKIAIGYQKSQEIKFLWNINPQAIPGTYNYNLRLRFLKSTSFYTVQPKLRQLTILRTKVKPQIDNIEPSFAITPSSSSTKPIILSSRDILTVEIEVHNRSKNVDNYRISTDLENSWYTIRYSETIKRVGAIEGNEALNLNPNQQGKIHLTINPPADTVAGNYKPEITLYSLNYPDLFLKKILYLNIPPKYLIQAELQTILNKVSYKKGQYKINLDNQGNTFRVIDIRVYTSDEDECCEYYLEPSSARIPPNKTIEIKLEVKPDSKQKRPFLSTKQFNFQVDLIDRKGHPLPKNLPLKSNLFWRSRPLWQTILLFFIALSCVGVAAWFIWKTITTKEPKPELTLTPEKSTYYYEGEPITVDWTVKYFGKSNKPESIDRVLIFDRELGASHSNTKCYYFDEQLNYQNCTLISASDSNNNCQTKKNTICHQDKFIHAKNVKEYTLKMQAFDRRNEIIDEQTTKIAILPRETFEVIEPITISPPKSKYKPTDSIELKFKVSQFNSLKERDKISLFINDEVKTIINSQNREEYCSALSNDYQCTIEISPLKDGEHNLRIETEYDPDGLIKAEPKNISIPKQIIIQTPIEFIFFKINGKSNPQIEVKPKETIQVEWSVKGKGVTANISCIPENIRSSGTKNIEILPGRSETCTLTASDTHGNSITPKNITVFRKEEPKPEPPPPQPIIINPGDIDESP